MSAIRTVTCDGCGAVKPAEPVRLWWDFQFTSMDRRVEGGFAFLSGSWDFCPDCATKAHEALVAIGGVQDGDKFGTAA